MFLITYKINNTFFKNEFCVIDFLTKHKKKKDFEKNNFQKTDNYQFKINSN